jgi:CRP-like cAMP-binding protein
MLGPGDFFGEGCLAGQPLRMGTATAVMPTALLRIAKRDMIRMLHDHPEFSDRFIPHMLTRNIRIEEDLVDQLFNSSDSRALCCSSRDTAKRTRHSWSSRDSRRKRSPKWSGRRAPA